VTGGRTGSVAAAALAALLSAGEAHSADEPTGAQVLWECRTMESVLIDGMQDAKAVMSDLAMLGNEPRTRQRLALHDTLLQALVRSEMAASALIRLRCPNRAVLPPFEEDMRRAWTVLASNRQTFLRAIPP
jgi:signal transduction histidine kinase